MTETPGESIKIPNVKLSSVVDLSQGWTQEAGSINEFGQDNPNKPYLTGTLYIAEADTHPSLIEGQKFLIEASGYIIRCPILEKFNHGDEVDIFSTANGLVAELKK